VTDPGVPGKQNQDEFFVWQSDDKQSVVVGILDGHGRELGQLAARVARDSLRGSLASPAALAAVALRPAETLEAAFAKAHADIEAAFRKVYEDGGWRVERTPEGYLLRSPPPSPKPQSGGPPPPPSRGGSAAVAAAASGPPLCVHGGTTATVLIILHGRRIVVSNVGDSTAIVCGLGARAGALRPVSEWTSLAGAPSRAQLLRRLEAAPAQALDTYMELSADHSPESESEFQRMHKFRPHPTLRHHPELFFVYDTLTASKLACPPIFEVNPSTGACRKTEGGTYYKNVRSEWASLVATPPHAGFQDALAFTRSLGDLHLQSYGVSHTPETYWMDLTLRGVDGDAAGDVEIDGASYVDAEDVDSPTSPASAADGAAGGGASANRRERALVGHPISLCVSSDGIWDNWRFEDVASFLNEPKRVDRVLQSRSAVSVATELMAENLNRSRANFGSSADNMTAIVIYAIARAAI